MKFVLVFLLTYLPIVPGRYEQEMESKNLQSVWWDGDKAWRDPWENKRFGKKNNPFSIETTAIKNDVTHLVKGLFKIQPK